MSLLRRLLLTLGLNAVPIAGITIASWGSATAMASYWFESLLGVFLISIRIAAHRRSTRKQGHYRAQLNSGGTVRVGSPTHTGKTTFLAEYLTTGLVFTLAHGFFLAFFAFVTNQTPDLEALRTGIGAIATLQLVGFAFDMLNLRERPFAWLRHLAQLSIGRIVLIHLALIAGVALAAIFAKNDLFLLPFAVMKLLADIAGVLRFGVREDVVPGWLPGVMNKLKPGGDFEAYLASERERERAQALIDEAAAPERSTGRKST